MDSFGVMVRVRVGIRVYVKRIIRLQNHRNQSHAVIFGASELVRTLVGCKGILQYKFWTVIIQSFIFYMKLFKQYIHSIAMTLYKINLLRTCGSNLGSRLFISTMFFLTPLSPRREITVFKALIHRLHWSVLKNHLTYKL